MMCSNFSFSFIDTDLLLLSVFNLKDKTNHKININFNNFLTVAESGRGGGGGGGGGGGTVESNVTRE